VDIISGATVGMDYQNMTEEEYPIGVLASTALPVIFPPQKYRDYLLADGGTSWNNNMIFAIEKCRALGFSDE